MSRTPHESKQIRRSQPSEASSRGVAGAGTEKGSEGKSEPRVRSILIEPREGEPPRVSVSVEYDQKAPDVNAMRRAAIKTIHGVVKDVDEGGANALVDLGERQDVIRGRRTQSFSLEQGESK